MHILGIDPGVATIGIGIIEITSPYDIKAKDWLTIRTKASTLFADRLQEIQDDIMGILKEHHPDIAVIERLFFAKNKQTALEVAHARGVILCTISRTVHQILEPSPPQWKLAITGDGSASKEQIQRMIQRQLHLSQIPRPDDAADALALALYGATHSSLFRQNLCLNTSF
ncbi:crossover junction endodeoxyribonuclease RuvC [Candidatus Peribacteria bacterium RIFCSPHIGHO2_02_FULL_49_16]|nr:MAG: crossover junction endodeoxyribonuclease RuvC [Candidatus Peribacteria bacterium RIFCSPHIGHO2_01_FULL_49_38]OGJ58502.1 MAG: crossover junction endodeoxyribonuclease RuvC [Candidatus Peribacteria bacterium RIFCSPHIGHO2_02_FULL_49_16]